MNTNRWSRVRSALALLGLFSLSLSLLAPLFAQAQGTSGNGAVSDGASIEQYLKSSNLPIGNISLHKTPNAKGLVIYIPQIHQNPGSDAMDPSNDTAQVAQTQIYDILKALNRKKGVTLVMNEGEMSGPVPASHIKYVKDKMQHERSLRSSLSALGPELGRSNLDSRLVNQTMGDVKQEISRADRQIILRGAAYKLDAEGANLQMYGAETSSTFNKSADLVRNYIYLQDRLNQLTGGTGQIAATANIQQASASTVSKASADITQLQQLSQGLDKSNLASELGQVQNQISVLDEADVNGPPNTNAPSRANNPYAGVNDPAVIESKLSAAQGDITQTVIQQRNADAASNFAQALASTGQNVGVLIFGSGHESGLVPALEQKGLSVLVVTPKEVQNAPQNSASPTASQGAAPTASGQQLLQVLQKIMQQKGMTSQGSGSGQSILQMLQGMGGSRKASGLSGIISGNSAAKNPFSGLLGHTQNPMVRTGGFRL